jgi:hypothetical protein
LLTSLTLPLDLICGFAVLHMDFKMFWGRWRSAFPHSGYGFIPMKIIYYIANILFLGFRWRNSFENGRIFVELIYIFWKK